MNPELIELLRAGDAAIAAGADSEAVDADISAATRGQFDGLDRLRLVLTLQSQEGGSPADRGQTAPLPPVAGQGPRNRPAGGAQPYNPRELLRAADAALEAEASVEDVSRDLARATRGEVTSLDNLRLGVEGPEDGAFPGPVRAGTIGAGQALTGGLVDGFEPDQAEVRNVLRRMHPVAWRAGQVAGVGTGARVAAGSLPFLRAAGSRIKGGGLLGFEGITAGIEKATGVNIPQPTDLLGN